LIAATSYEVVTLDRDNGQIEVIKNQNIIKFTKNYELFIKQKKKQNKILKKIEILNLASSRDKRGAVGNLLYNLFLGLTVNDSSFESSICITAIISDNSKFDRQ
jgi:hypothetical protein